MATSRATAVNTCYAVIKMKTERESMDFLAPLRETAKHFKFLTCIFSLCLDRTALASGLWFHSGGGQCKVR